MRYATIRMICAHAQKDRSTVIRALKAAQIKPEKFPGCHGLRIKERDVNTFLARQCWTKNGEQVGPLPLPSLV